MRASGIKGVRRRLLACDLRCFDLLAVLVLRRLVSTDTGTAPRARADAKKQATKTAEGLNTCTAALAQCKRDSTNSSYVAS